MRKQCKSRIKGIGVIYIALILTGTIYLIIPSPGNFPDLPNSYKSIEPGDTTQIKNISAYYSDEPRILATTFYRNYFSRSRLWGIPLPTIRLNHPPERIREVLRATQQATFAEEFVHPLRESVFVSGFEWNNDPFTPPAQRIQNAPFVNNRSYAFKITVFYQPTPVWQRLLVFYFTVGLIYLLVRQYKGLIKRISTYKATPCDSARRSPWL